MWALLKFHLFLLALLLVSTGLYFTAFPLCALSFSTEVEGPDLLPFFALARETHKSQWNKTRLY
jgi:hypothetical protein